MEPTVQEVFVAVFCQVRVARGTQEDSINLEQRVEQRLEAAGGPPEGLIFLCVHPEDDGFRIAMVFRSIEAAHAEVDGHLRSEAAEVGIELGELAVDPVWGMALPGAY
ncbi:MAG: hypothetical protein WD250_10020 [Egibacteraceae bacterium]